MRLILLRHGETAWNIEGRLQGHDNSPLSQRGIAQAEAIRPYVRALAPARVVTSDLGRARQTAEIIGHGASASDIRLRELNMGAWTGQKKAEIIAQDPRLYADWRAGRHTPEGGESWDEFAARVKSAILELVYAGQGDLLVVVHSGVVRATCFGFLGLTPAQLLPVTPGTLTILDFDDKDPSVPPRLEGYNVGAFAPDIAAAD